MVVDEQAVEQGAGGAGGRVRDRDDTVADTPIQSPVEHLPALGVGVAHGLGHLGRQHPARPTPRMAFSLTSTSAPGS